MVVGEGAGDGSQENVFDMVWRFSVDRYTFDKVIVRTKRERKERKEGEKKENVWALKRLCDRAEIPEREGRLIRTTTNQTVRWDHRSHYFNRPLHIAT